MNDSTTNNTSESRDGFELLVDECLDAKDESGTSAEKHADNSGGSESTQTLVNVSSEEEKIDAGELGAEMPLPSLHDNSSDGASSVDESAVNAQNTDETVEMPAVPASDDVTNEEINSDDAITSPFAAFEPVIPVKNPTPPAKRNSMLAAQPNSLNKKGNGKLDKKKKRAHKKRIVWAVVGVLFALGVIVGYFAVQGIGVPVNTVKAEAGDVVITVFATGAITSGESKDVYPETQGLIKTVDVSEGDIVEEGTILATLDDVAAQAQLSQAEAALAQARSGLSQAEAGRDQAAASQAQANAGVTAAQAALDSARAGLDTARDTQTISRDARNSARDTVRSMRSSGAATADPVAFAQAEAALQQAEATLEQARGGVTQARGGVTQAEAALAQARAGRDAARAVETGSVITAAQAAVEAAQDGVALAEATLEATIIRAPKDGMVLFAPTAVSAAAMGTGITPTSGTELATGSAVAPGSPLFTIVNESALSFTAEVDEVDVRRLSVGQTAEVTLSAYSGRTFRAEISAISNTAKPTVTGGTVFDVELTFAEELPGIRIGMRGDTSIEIETLAGVLTIPIDAWFSEGGESFVYKIDEENRLVKVPIVTGASTEFVVEIGDGLSEGDTVVIAGGAGAALEEGLPVMPTATP